MIASGLRPICVRSDFIGGSLLLGGRPVGPVYSMVIERRRRRKKCSRGCSRGRPDATDATGRDRFSPLWAFSSGHVSIPFSRARTDTPPTLPPRIKKDRILTFCRLLRGRITAGIWGAAPRSLVPTATVLPSPSPARCSFAGPRPVGPAVLAGPGEHRCGCRLCEDTVQAATPPLQLTVRLEPARDQGAAL